MLRQIMMEDVDRKVFKATADEWKAVDLNFKGYLEDAVEFVNGPDGQFLWDHLKT